MEHVHGVHVYVPACVCVRVALAKGWTYSWKHEILSQTLLGPQERRAAIFHVLVTYI